MCVYNCKLSYTVQYRTVLIILPPNHTRQSSSQMLSIGGKGWNGQWGDMAI